VRIAVSKATGPSQLNEEEARIQKSEFRAASKTSKGRKGPKTAKNLRIINGGRCGGAENPEKNLNQLAQPTLECGDLAPLCLAEA